MKPVLIISITVVLLLILFVPIYCGQSKDSGTKSYRALTYTVVKWRRYTDEQNDYWQKLNENGNIKYVQLYKGMNTYIKTSIYFFPNSQKSLEELWKLETK